jgi:hypothetical protein
MTEEGALAKHPVVSGVPESETGVKPVKSEARAVERDAARLDGPGSAETSFMPVVSLVPGILHIRDAPSGASYRWEKSGDTVQVRQEDVEYLLSFNHGGARACCGGGGERVYFQLPLGG